MPTRKTKEPESTPEQKPSPRKRAFSKRRKGILDPETGRVKDPATIKKRGPAAGAKYKKRKAKVEVEKPAEPVHAPDAKELEILERRNKILDLREGGASIRQISAHLTAQGLEGCSATRVHELLADALEDALKTQTLKAAHIIKLELNRIDRLILAHYSLLLKQKNPDSVEKLSRAVERYWKRHDSLLGLAKPQKVEMSGPDGGPIETTIVPRVILPAGIEDIEPEKEDGQ